ncbi:putative uncharacterized protein [Parachlamydia acanthamoebae UV-7]|uniref:DUF3880 domain-containing protein n=1 Tax=Parachlamydia acanthamoebae (strain UV7) TaxID=765952 RepID=F8KUR3_PARAV|nr:hypothetical protein [Parachlamydia acanthamoebae]CCB84978.1 putative uncharacterized protein [Parachlamydia acanthamoebae UV-7]
MKKTPFILRVICVCYVLLGALLPNSHLEAFDKVVIWGHKLHSHTHSYIHNSFYQAFKHLGYTTYWFDDLDYVGNFDFANSLFITEGQADQNIPIRHDCQYILHNCTAPKYQALKPENWVILQVYTDSVLERPDAMKMEPCIYFDLVERCLYMPWATDLFPHEIEQMKQKIASQVIQKTIYWIGTVGGGEFGNQSRLDPFIQACRENGIQFSQLTGISTEKAVDLICQSYIAPTVVGEWQEKVGYIPCRIFKNISYGKMGVTNSQRVHELFEGKIVYNADTYQLFYDAKRHLETMPLQEIYDLMDLVKTKHTYLNRVKTMLDFADLVKIAYQD